MVTLSEPRPPLPNTQDTQRGPGWVRALLMQFCLCPGPCPSLTGIPRAYLSLSLCPRPLEEPEWFSGGKIQPPLGETPQVPGADGISRWSLGVPPGLGLFLALLKRHDNMTPNRGGGLDRRLKALGKQHQARKRVN